MGKGGGAKIPTSAELMQMAEFENTINNPNTANMFGNQTFTRGADGRQSATSELSPEMQGLMDGVIGNLTQGPPQFNQQRNPYTESMMNGFSEKIGGRAGFSPAEYEGAMAQDTQAYNMSAMDVPQPGFGGEIDIPGRGFGLDGGLMPNSGRYDEGNDQMMKLMQRKDKYQNLAGGDYSGAGIAGVAANGIGSLLGKFNDRKISKAQDAQKAREDLRFLGGGYAK